jgi:hypothetical protein
LDSEFKFPNTTRGVMYFKYCLLHICVILFDLKALKVTDCVILFLFSFMNFTVQIKHFVIHLCHKRKR